jgi:ABC-type sugar transport system permease subunit
MGLIEKIEEIRKKPDHIKLRYVWFFVAICMILVIAIWFFSLKTSLGKSFFRAKTNSTSDVQKTGLELLKEIERQKESMNTLSNAASKELEQNTSN